MKKQAEQKKNAVIGEFKDEFGGNATIVMEDTSFKGDKLPDYPWASQSKKDGRLRQLSKKIYNYKRLIANAPRLLGLVPVTTDMELMTPVAKLNDAIKQRAIPQIHRIEGDIQKRMPDFSIKKFKKVAPGLYDVLTATADGDNFYRNMLLLHYKAIYDEFKERDAEDPDWMNKLIITNNREVARGQEAYKAREEYLQKRNRKVV